MLRVSRCSSCRSTCPNYLEKIERKITKVFYVTDLTSVLQYISNTDKGFKIYVANRLATIH